MKEDKEFFTNKELLLLATLQEKYGDVVDISYDGAGDSFGSFYHCSVGDEFLDEPGVDDLLWKAINLTQADFNNDGSRGDIMLYLKESRINIQNYWIVQKEELSDDIDLGFPEEETP